MFFDRLRMGAWPPFAWRLLLGSGLTLACFSLHLRQAAGAPQVDYFTYESSITAGDNGPLSLNAAVAYPEGLAPGANAPVAVVMHGYSPATGNISEYLSVARSQAAKGFVSIVVAMRGRDGSAGKRDSGGLEIYDIYDAVEHLKADPFFADKVDPANVHISGYSGGGGNVMSALTKFPDYFNLGAAYFGMSDYGYDRATGWYYNGANVGGTRTPTLNADIGYRPSNDPAILDKYLARASNRASQNNPYSEIHLFVNSDEPICPPVNSLGFRDNAVAHESYAGEFDNIAVHLGSSDSSAWVDHNNDGIKQSAELQNWPHGLSSAIQDRGEAWYLDRLLAGAVPQPQLSASDELFVPGYVRTKAFQIWLGDGQNAAGEFQYDLGSEAMTFDLALASLDKSVTGKLTVYQNRLRTNQARIELNGQVVATADVSNGYVFDGLRDGDSLRLVAVPEPSAACMLCSAVLLGWRSHAAKRCCARCN